MVSICALTIWLDYKSEYQGITEFLCIDLCFDIILAKNEPYLFFQGKRVKSSETPEWKV